MTTRFILLGENPLKEIGIGVAIGVLFILLNLLAPSITIGFPLVPQATEGERLGIVGFAAPIGEELAFRFIALNILLFMGVPIFIIIILQVVVFSLFHATAYAGSLALQNITSNIGAFVGAGIFSLIVTMITLHRRSFLAAIVIHMIFNIYLVTKLFVVVAL